MSLPQTSGIPLTEYRKDCPPGWGPGDSDYPLKLYFERLRMWYRLYDGADETVGPLIAGRLVGRAQTIALQLRLPDPHGNVDVGDAALVRLAVDEVRDPMNPNIILQQHIPSGVSALCRALRDAFGEADQLQVTKSLEEFFDCRRGRLSLQEFSVEWSMKLDQAILHAGLQLNAVARTFLFFRAAQLPQKHVDDIMMQLQGDMNRFDEARALALRLAHRQPEGVSSHYEAADYYGIEDEYEQSWHTGISTYWDEYHDADDGYTADWKDYDSGWSQYAFEAEEFYDPESYYDEEAWYDESWNEEPETTEEAAHVDDENFYQGGKTFNLGCSICGSKWHSASTCPMSKGSSKGYGKSKGKGGKSFSRFGKGKGKSKGKHKGQFHRPYGQSFKGRGKGYGRKGYWTSGEYSPQRRQEQQLRHAREGLQLNLMSSPSQAVNPPTAVTSPSMTSDEPDLLRLPRPVRLSTPPDGTSGGGAEATSASSAKHLNFPVQVNQSSETDTINSYHLIHGIKRRGLLVDPGAAAGLIGSETLRDLICECLTPQGLQDQIQWRERTTSVTGISGKGDETMAEVSFRFALGTEKTGTFTGDVLGGDGSLCPPLISNPSLRSLRAVICSSWFENGDGLLVCPSDDGKPENSTMIRLLLTDSGHYIIPMDASPSVKDTEQKKARTFLHSTFEITSQQWQDVRAQNKYCFKVDQNVNDQEDLERNEKKNDSNTLTTSMAENATMPVIQATSSTPSSTSSTMPVILATPDSTSPTTGTMPVILATTSPSSTTSSTLPVMTGKDHWKKVENQWHRIHVRPRTALFSPAHGKFPDILDNIYEKRETHVHYVNGEDDTILDTWQVPEAQQPLRQKWTGVTIFEIKQKEQTCDVGEIYIGDREDHNFAEDELAAYEKDTFPEHITEEKRRYLEKFYKAVPEEFYTKLKRKPVTPATCLSWAKKQKGRHFHFWELCSGSSRLSLLALLSGLCVMFPIDFRYGWDIGYAPHQQLLRQVANELEPDILFGSPNCRPWSVSSNQKPPEVRQQLQKEEEPGLQLLEELCHKQVQEERYYLLEQPWSSALWKRLEKIPGTCSRTDQCRFDATDEQQQPILKPTGLQSNGTLHQSVKRCGGHSQPHGWLQGQTNGCNRTTIAAVYPIKLCRAILKDVKKMIKLSTEVLYGCERCQLGRWAPKHMEHSFLPGDCRYGRYPKEHPKSKESKEEQKKTDLRENFRQEALSSKKVNEGTLATIPEIGLTTQQTSLLKYSLMKIPQYSMEEFDDPESKNPDYMHWVTDPVVLSWTRSIFENHLKIAGICALIKPWTKPTPTPKLRPDSAFLRLMIRGTIAQWRMMLIEDLRDLSHSQCHEPVDFDEDWLICFFGVYPSLPSRPKAAVPDTPAAAPHTPAGAPKTPAMAPGTPAAPEAEPIVPLPEEIQEELLPQPYEEARIEPVQPGDQPTALKPLYDFKKIYDKLPKLAATDANKAKRLLLGLHERMWHCPVMDFQNLLRRCGQPTEVIRLASEVVSGCSICRKFVRATRRPQVKSSLAGSFNENVQIDGFLFKGNQYLLMIDEATRYKVAAPLAGRELHQYLSVLQNHWLRYFGPMRSITMDQESSLMTIDAGADFERIGITRIPAGTTSGHEGQKHTGTGLVEKHIDLVKTTMAKILAEAARYNIVVEPNELSAEAAMSHNMTLNVGDGYTPSMCVFGVLPRGYLDPEEVPLSVSDRSQELSTFERAARLRQISLQCAQASILEDRITRAARSRPSRIDLGELKPGSTEVEIFRDDGSHGWRGPAMLLKINEGQGTVIVEYQGRPYLMSIRHIRPYRGSFLVYYDQHNHEESLSSDIECLQKFVEEQVPYKSHTIGVLLDIDADKQQKWRQVPTEPSSRERSMLQKAIRVAKQFTKSSLQGIRFGRGVKTIYVPRFSKGILISWPENSSQYTLVEQQHDRHLTLKRILHQALDNVCHIYFYFYTMYGEEPMQRPAPVTTRQMPEQSMPHPMNEDGDVEVGDNLKRDAPDSRTIIMAPEKKKQRIHFSITEQQLLMQSVHWMLRRPLQVQYESPEVLLQEDTFYNYTLEDSTDTVQKKSIKPGYLFHFSSKTTMTLHVDLRTQEILKVDTETDVLTEAQLIAHWPLFEKSDADEIAQFVHEDAFEKLHISQVSDDMVVVDCTWVRKFKRNPDGSKKAKSRLCARGFMDAQKAALPTRSTTATRLSQRILVSMAAALGLQVESLDVSGAFLKGLSFHQVRKLLNEKGHNCPQRTVIVIPPANVWRHLAAVNPKFNVSEEKMSDWVLLAKKPIYGLVDAPLAWQLCLHQFIEANGGLPSYFDENMFMWKNEQGKITALMTTHVDDLAIASDSQQLDKFHNDFQKQFGKVSRQVMPFQHCGCRYTSVPCGIRIDQEEFTENLKIVDVQKSSDEERTLTPEEVTQYRSQLGALLWLTATRLDLISDVCQLQTFVTQAKVKHLKAANNVVKRAKDPRFKSLGLVYRHLDPNRPWRIMCIHDASAASKGRVYAHEGILILLAHDTLDLEDKCFSISGEDFPCSRFGGSAHILWAQGNKAKRVSYSTSHGETLAAINGMESASLIALRLGELLVQERKPTLQRLAALQERGVPFLPVDAYTDCRDFFELSTGVKTMPQDKSQRIYIMAHREARLRGRLRWLILIPTECMTSDALTKPMISASLNELMSSGVVRFFNVQKHPILARRLPPVDDIDEGKLMTPDRELLSAFAYAAWTIKPNAGFAFLCLSALLTQATATTVGDTKEESDYGAFKMLIIFTSVIAIVLWIAMKHMVEKMLSAFNKREAEQSCERPAHFETSEQKTQTETSFQEHPQNVTELEEHLARQRDENQKLREENKNLQVQVTRWQKRVDMLSNRIAELNQWPQDDETRILKARILEHRQYCPCNRSVYITDHGDCFHNSKECSKLKIARSVYEKRACQNCASVTL